MELHTLVISIANALKGIDATHPVCKAFKPGIGPFGEPQLIAKLSERLINAGYVCKIARKPDLTVEHWALECKIVRPFGDNGKQAENWSVRLLHPYHGNISAIGDAFKLLMLGGEIRKAILVIAYEHRTPKITLDPLLESFELIARCVCQIQLGQRVEERRGGLVHPVHQVLRCIAWEVLS